MYRFEWNRKLCGNCPERARCLGLGQAHRTLVVGEHPDRLQARRLEQKTDAFRADMKHRNGIEDTLSELVCGHGLRRGWCRGLSKTRLQNWFISAVCNLKCWCRRQAWDLKRATGAMGAGMPVAVAV